MIDLSVLMRRISDLAALIAGKPDLYGAIVTGADPLEIRLDAAPSPLQGKPDTLVSGLQVDDRVLVAMQNHRALVLGRRTGYPAATETSRGVAEIATQAEANTGADDERYMTPKTVRERGYAPFAEAAGVVAQQSVAATASVAVTVTFPAGRFTQPPMVLPGKWGNARDTNVGVDNVTTSSCTVRLESNSTVSRTIGAYWHAIQMTSGSGAG